VSKPLSRIEPSRDPQWVAGVIASTRTMMGRRGKMLFVILDDGTAQVEVAVYSELIEQHRNRLRDDQLLILQVKVSNDEYSGGMRVAAEHIYDLQLAREARAKSLRIRLNGNADAAMLKRVLNPFRASPENGFAGTPVEVIYENARASCTLRLGDGWRVRLSDTLVEQLTTWTSASDVEVTY
jgi:DNA polymerase-3 subunit alpha